jgi:hypothetical protein
MSDKNDSDLEIWAASEFAEEKIPGSAEPLEGKCGARMRDKRAKELGLERFCQQRSGKNTPTVGQEGVRCSLHGGATKSHQKAAVEKVMSKEFVTITEKLGDLTPLGPPEVEAFQLATKAKRWLEYVEGQMGALGELANTDRAGIEHARAVVEIFERAMDRMQNYLAFALKFNLASRVVELEERQARLIAQAYISIILSQEMKLSEKQVATAREMFAEKMTELGPSLVPTWSTDTPQDDGSIIDAEIVD